MTPTSGSFTFEASSSVVSVTVQMANKNKLILWFSRLKTVYVGPSHYTLLGQVLHPQLYNYHSQ